MGTEGPHVLRGHPGPCGEGDRVTSPSPVYKAKLVATEETPSHDNYIMTILSIIKAGTSTPGVGDNAGGQPGGLVALGWLGVPPGGLASPSGAGDIHEGSCRPGGVVPPRVPVAPWRLKVPTAGCGKVGVSGWR